MAKSALKQSAALGAGFTPQNKPTTSGTKLFGRDIDPDVGKATQIKPGECRNPGGRPKKLPLTERLLKFIDKKVVVKGVVDAEGRDWGDLAMEGLTKAAAKGKPEAAREMFLRIEGSVPNVFNGANGETIPATVAVTEVNVQVETRALVTVIREIYGLQEKGAQTILGVTAGNGNHSNTSSNGAGTSAKPTGTVPVSEDMDTRQNSA